MSNRKTLDERIEAAKAEVAQKEARVKELLQQQKAQERKDRNHRLCLRGGKLEKLLPELARLTEEQFEIFVEKCLLTSFTRRTLAELAPPEPEQPDGGDTAAPKPTGPAHNPGANGNAGTATSARAVS